MPRQKGIRLQNKALGLGLVLSVVVLAATDLALFSAHGRHIMHGWDESHRAALQDWKRMCEKAFERHQERLLQPLAEVVLLGPLRIDYAYLADARGKILAHSNAMLVSKYLDEWHQASPQTGMIERRQPLTLPDGSAGWVGIGYPEPREDAIRSIIQTQQKHMIPPVLLANLLILLLVGGIAVLVARTIIRPVETLAGAVRRVSLGDLDARVKVSGGDELSDLERDFNMMARRLRELDDLKTDFLAKITHDLRNPLGAIIGHAELLLMGARGPLNERQRESLESTTRSAGFLNELVTNILDMTKLEAKRMAYEKSAIALKDVVGPAAALMRGQAETFGVSLLEALPADLPLVMADPKALQRVINNLVSNALKFTPKGGTVTIEAAPAPGGVTVAVRDTGIGIPPEKLSAVFSKFAAIHQRCDLPRRVHGTGLGLAICKEIVEGHGGRISVRSEPGKGTVFSFQLPTA
ncbi:MAG: HAMP domain-containing protein [Elusimicrobia bacterium]|nr:HAMP domain-containing protein [Elusimicrobiota bacterium]